MIEDPVKKCAAETFCSVSVNLAGSMWLEVVARKSSLFWRQTDDGRHPCVFSTATRPAKVMGCGHYVLGVVTEETSDSRRTKLLAYRSDTHDANVLLAFVWSWQVCCECLLPAGRDFLQGTAFVGLAET